jgi:hypothetical protein
MSGNGYPKTDTQWVKTLSGYGYDDFFIPVCILLSHLLYLFGMVGVDMFSLISYPLPSMEKKTR